MKLRSQCRLVLYVALWVIGPALLAAETSPDTNGKAPAEQKLERRTLKDCLLPAVKNGGFRMDDFILWCPSVIKVGETYHMFASRWPGQYGLGGWTSHSECV